jgi:hypothetical protein
VELHGRLGDAEPAADLLVRQVVEEPFEDSPLRARQRTADGVAGTHGAGRLDPPGEEAAGRPERTSEDAAQGREELVGPGVESEDALHAEAQGRQDHVRDERGEEGHDADSRTFPQEPFEPEPRRRPGPGEVGENHVRGLTPWKLGGDAVARGAE